jgi:hypothetical protein
MIFKRNFVAIAPEIVPGFTRFAPPQVTQSRGDPIASKPDPTVRRVI